MISIRHSFLASLSSTSFLASEKSAILWHAFSFARYKIYHLLGSTSVTQKRRSKVKIFVRSGRMAVGQMVSLLTFERLKFLEVNLDSASQSRRWCKALFWLVVVLIWRVGWLGDLLSLVHLVGFINGLTGLGTNYLKISMRISFNVWCFKSD